ncbi:MAG: two component transcriptional regulator, LuxR family [Proteobacteria bacterium]|nr:two component transcriptional regulator, LuxR family [Pseudomonadota bacterium]
MPMHDLTVFIVDDDASVRDALSLVFSIRGYRTAVFSGAKDLLKAWKANWAGCLLIDIRMPGMDGLSLQDHLIEMGSTLPVVVITGHGDVDSARRAFKANAIDFLEKPIDLDKMIEAIEQAFNSQSLMQDQRSASEQASYLLDQLTPREQEVMSLVVGGYHNREIAEKLGISVRTVEVHKAHVMSKLDVDSVADLVRLSMSRR